MIRLILKRGLLPDLKDEEKLIYAIQLSRILSSLRYNQIIHEKIFEKDNGNTNIQLNLLINHAAVLCEGIKKFETLKAKLVSLDAYKENIVKIKNIFNETENENSFYNTVIYKIRNKIAFHFDEDVITEVLEEYIDEHLKEKEDIVFFQGKTELVADTIYPLADNINFHYILKSIKGENLSDKDRFIILSKELLNLSKLFIGILENIIPELIQDYCELKEDYQKEITSFMGRAIKKFIAFFVQITQKLTKSENKTKNN